MPEISRFYGIVISMFFRQKEHPLPHIHATYAEQVASFNIKTGQLTGGYLRPTAKKLVEKWLKKNKKALEEMWETQTFKKLPGLE